MYKNGEIEMVMAEFEKSLNSSPIYVGGTIEKAERQEVTLDDGRTSKRYVNNNYYNNGNVNHMFMMFLHGYALGKHEGRDL